MTLRSFHLSFFWRFDDLWLNMATSNNNNNNNDNNDNDNDNDTNSG